MSVSIDRPVYRIETERTVIRCWDPRDAYLLKEAVDASLDHLKPWMPWADQEPTDIEAKVQVLRGFRGRFDLGQDFAYGIFDPDEQRVIGGTGLHARLGKGALEIGYWIRVDCINCGLATEAAAALTRVAFQAYDVNRAEIHCDPQNVRSAAVPRKLGFTHEATLRQCAGERWPAQRRDDLDTTQVRVFREPGGAVPGQGVRRNRCQDPVEVEVPRQWMSSPRQPMFGNALLRLSSPD